MSAPLAASSLLCDPAVATPSAGARLPYSVSIHTSHGAMQSRPPAMTATPHRIAPRRSSARTSSGISTGTPSRSQPASLTRIARPSTRPAATASATAGAALLCASR